MSYVNKNNLQEYSTKLWERIKLLYNSPLVAALAEEMLDPDRVYVYTGSEPDYTAGDWYFFDGSDWVSGGVYNAVAINTDTTLSVPGEAADAKATGDIIGDWVFEIAETVNLVQYNSRTGSTAGITRESLPDGAMCLDGTANGTGRLIIRYGLPEGTYKWAYTVLSGTTTGGWTLRYRPSGSSTWSEWAAGATLTVGSGGCDVCVTVTSGVKFTAWVAQFRIYPASESDNLKLYTRSAVDRELREERFVVHDEVEGGALSTTTGKTMFSYGAFFNYRRLKHFISVQSAPVKISISEKDIDAVSTIRVVEYIKDANGIELANFSDTLSLTNGSLWYVPGEDTTHIKITLQITDSDRKYGPIRFASEQEIRVVKNFAMPHQDYYRSNFFTYQVSDDNYTTGQLMLPPNYDPEGAPVPLLLYIHGTGRFATWDMGINITETGHDWKSLWDYILDEGFAVFDCYPWTAKYYSANEQVSPYPIDLHARAYIEGVKYVVDNFNVDGNNVGAFCKSLGGALGYYLMQQRELNLRGIAMLATSVGWVSTIWGTYFINADARRPVVNYLGLADEEGASSFITNGSTDNSGNKAFVEDHLDKFGPLNYCAVGTHGATMQQMYEWMSQGRKTAPEWMQELINAGFMEMWPSDWNDYNSKSTGMPLLIDHPDLSKFTPIPVKYWYAWDDVNAPAHASYTVYRWLQNGGSPVEWRTLPSGTGAHYATDNTSSATAVTTSGVTRLGLPYSDVNITWVEMADFFYNHMQFGYSRA